jgi:hypothetical protein
LFRKKRQDTIIEKVGRSDRRFGRIQLGCRPLRVCVHEGLLVNPPHAFYCPDVEGILTSQIARVRRFDFAVSDVIILLFLQRLNLALSQYGTHLCHMLFQGSQAALEGLLTMA